MSEFHFLLFPDLVQDKILSYLDPLELLNFRRVCRAIKNDWVERFKKGKWNELAVRLEKPSDYNRYFKCSLNVPKIRISKFADPKIPSVAKFLEHCAPFIKTIEVDYFFRCEKEMEIAFFQHFSSLEELELDEISYPREPIFSPVRFPDNFKQLKVLKVNNLIHCHNENGTAENNNYFFELIKFCPDLETFRIPQLCCEIEQVTVLPTFFNKWMEIVRDREIQNVHSHLKCIDLNKIYIWEVSMPEYLNFLGFCFERKIQLMGVRSNQLERFDASNKMDVKKVDQTILTLDGLFNSKCLQFGLDNLKSLTISWDLVNNGGGDGSLVPPAFPNLRSLTVVLGLSQQMDQYFMNIFFPMDSGMRRTTLEDLDLNFCGSSEDLVNGAIQPSRILTVVPNLKKLTLSRFNWNADQFKTLFKGLAGLEVLELELCDTLSDAVLIGKNQRNPVFLNLVGLKKLQINTFQKDRITDRALKEVFSKMNLQEFNLGNHIIYFCGLLPVLPHNITAAGIAALAEGPFGSAIRRFHCQGFSLADVTKKPVCMNRRGRSAAKNLNKLKEEATVGPSNNQQPLSKVSSTSSKRKRDSNGQKGNKNLQSKIRRGPKTVKEPDEDEEKGLAKRTRSATRNKN